MSRWAFNWCPESTLIIEFCTCNLLVNTSLSEPVVVSALSISPLIFIVAPSTKAYLYFVIPLAAVTVTPEPRTWSFKLGVLLVAFNTIPEPEVSFKSAIITSSDNTFTVAFVKVTQLLSPETSFTKPIDFPPNSKVPFVKSIVAVFPDISGFPV